MELKEKKETDSQKKLPIDISLLQKRYMAIYHSLLNRALKNDDFEVVDPKIISKAFWEAAEKIIADPKPMLAAQTQFWSDWLELWQRSCMRSMGKEANPIILPDKTDRRFKDEDWQKLVPYDFLKQSYLLAARAIEETMGNIADLSPKTRHKVDFYTRQTLDALAPSNFVLTNPVVMRTTSKQGGDNLLKGLNNLLNDLDQGKGKLAISMTDKESFKIGENIATTPGQVVYQNDLIQLIQYTPTTEKVSVTPLLIVPPWINKFYILDLREKNSYIKYCVDSGHTVFAISWVNPGSNLAHKGFEDYMAEGPLTALDVIQSITGSPQVNVVGYCIGGTLTACSLAWLSAQGQAGRIGCATFLVTLVDFSEAGDILVFIDEEQLENLDRHMKKCGYLAGNYMGEVFSMLRANDLIWSFIINNYLLGREPFPFDLLYWNNDSTGMPSMMHSFYLRNMYHENRLIQPDGITLKGVPIDLRKIETPCYLLSTLEDHIAPWKATYAATQLYSGPVNFVLSASGHIAGVINPPAAHKYCYWTNDIPEQQAETWLEGATRTEGSWWPHWQNWLTDQAGPLVQARQQAGSDLYPVLEAAPGEFVRRMG